MVRYRTSAGDVLDAVCLRHYGRVDVVPEVLAANPGLAAAGATLPAGRIVELPDLPPPPATARLRLWD
ncbi:tail protein X [Rhodocista pekingensis]|uniref:Tail protein X n=1 Tax=Rhodocista pekingensis TaxID=201185 RepID=A0ABW2KU68_9PROT